MLWPLVNSEEELVELQKHQRRHERRGGMVVWVEGQECVKIPLTLGLSTLIERSDYDYVGRFKWCAQWNWKSFIVKRHKDGKVVSLHREIMGNPEGMVIDHINGNTLDNRRCNLRIATQTQNQRNEKLRKNNTSGFKGVHYSRLLKKWIASIQDGPTTAYLGAFSTPELAAEAYDLAATLKDPEFCSTNRIIKARSDR